MCQSTNVTQGPGIFHLGYLRTLDSVLLTVPLHSAPMPKFWFLGNPARELIQTKCKLSEI